MRFCGNKPDEQYGEPGYSSSAGSIALAPTVFRLARIDLNGGQPGVPVESVARRTSLAVSTMRRFPRAFGHSVCWQQ